MVPASSRGTFCLPDRRFARPAGGIPAGRAYLVGGAYIQRASLIRWTSSGREAPMASTAREIMTGGVECVREDESVLDAAKKMRVCGRARRGQAGDGDDRCGRQSRRSGAHDGTA